MKYFFSLLIILTGLTSSAQTGTGFYGLARNVNPAEVFLATVDPATGQVSNLSSASLSSVINLTGAALDPYNNLYHYIGLNSMITVDLTTGALISDVPLSNPTGVNLSFDNFRFNNSDSSLYGLSRSVVYDSLTNSYNFFMYLATIDPSTGVISTISPSSIGQGFALAGSAIDPWQMVYYYSSGANLIGLDMYTGLVYSSAAISISGGDDFDNFTYSCADTGLYGLVRKNYFDTVYNPLDSSLWNLQLDSSTIRLGKIDPATGVVTIISPFSIIQGGYSLNAGATIDPNTMTYYFNNGQYLIGVSMLTGLIVSQQTLQNTNGQYFDMMRIPANCFHATEPIRPSPFTTSLTALNGFNVTVHPNPATDRLFIQSDSDMHRVDIVDMQGRVVLSQAVTGNAVDLDVHSLKQQVYLVRCFSEDGVGLSKLVK